MGDLYSIAGMFGETFIGESPFGGYFVRGMPREESSDSDENYIRGMFIDNYGPSHFEGSFNSERESFHL